ncbi:FAD binding domain-containing protein [Lentinula detonsa]|uniref:FAD binding domain-containing protein n=1 Tax=Lentinula detonsa TaxID=2804962 RepID=A0A9W8P2P3_9AGAR|nr:FAD binding domain-containing protein [Lentinula detonsa]
MDPPTHRSLPRIHRISARPGPKEDVLIIGAGPAGLMCAFALARAGVFTEGVRIVDQRPNKVAAGQADGIQPRTAEIFKSYGLSDRLLKEGTQLHVAAFYNPSKSGGIELTDRVPDVTATDTNFPFEVTLHQGAIEAIFLDNMRDMGVEVSRPVVPTSIEVDEDLVEDSDAYPVRVEYSVVLERTDSEPEDEEHNEIVHAKYVLGADGAHSWVRKHMRIAMEGEQTEYIWGVLDLVPSTNFPDVRNKCAIHSNNGSCMIIPREDDKIRLYIQLDESGLGKDFIDDASGRVDKSRAGPEMILDVARKTLYPFSIETPQSFDWWTIYIIGQRVAERYSVHDRVFIAGDACHTHSPKAGQGMNASMQDSYNLAWKLAHVLKGTVDRTLLKTYELERRKYAQDLINFDKKFAKLFSGKPHSELNSNGVSHAEFLQAFQTFGGFTSGLGVRYDESLIINPKHQHLAQKVLIGQRLPPRPLLRAADCRPTNLHDLLVSDNRFKLLVFTGDTHEPSQFTKVHEFAQELMHMASPGSFFAGFSSLEAMRAVFDIVSISSEKKETIVYNALPRILWSHWSKVLVDDIDMKGITDSGKVYESLGIDTTGAVIAVRPDGYVAAIAPLDATGVAHLTDYFANFIKPC